MLFKKIISPSLCEFKSNREINDILDVFCLSDEETNDNLFDISYQIISDNLKSETAIELLTKANFNIDKLVDPNKLRQLDFVLDLKETCESLENYDGKDEIYQIKNIQLIKINNNEAILIESYGETFNQDDIPVYLFF